MAGPALIAGITLGSMALGAIGQGLSNSAQRRAQEAFNRAQRQIFKRYPSRS